MPTAALNLLIVFGVLPRFEAIRPLARFLLCKCLSVDQHRHLNRRRLNQMRYAIAWLLGVPASIIIIWFVVGHVL
jgi:hypothetical protein